MSRTEGRLITTGNMIFYKLTSMGVYCCGKYQHLKNFSRTEGRLITAGNTISSQYCPDSLQPEYQFNVISQWPFTKGKTTSESDFNEPPKFTLFFRHPTLGWRQVGCFVGCAVFEILLKSAKSAQIPYSIRISHPCSLRVAIISD